MVGRGHVEQGGKISQDSGASRVAAKTSETPCEWLDFALKWNEMADQAEWISAWRIK
jgi:hypothetical protein